MGGRRLILFKALPLQDDNSDHGAEKTPELAGAAARGTADEIGMGQESPWPGRE